jgi:hypothetical protein
MSERKVVETATDARQGRRGRPVLIVLVSALILASIAWIGAEMWGEASDAPAKQTATPPAGQNSSPAPAGSPTPATPAPTDRTPHPDGGTGGDSQTTQPSGNTSGQ